MAYLLHQADCMQWLDEQPENSFEAIITDPPYGLKEYSSAEQAKLRDGNRVGMWRIPPLNRKGSCATSFARLYH